MNKKEKKGNWYCPNCGECESVYSKVEYTVVTTNTYFGDDGHLFCPIYDLEENINEGLYDVSVVDMIGSPCCNNCGEIVYWEEKTDDSEVPRRINKSDSRL